MRLEVFPAGRRGWCSAVSLRDLASGRWPCPPAPALLAGVCPGLPAPLCQRCGGCSASVATANGGLRIRARPPSCKATLEHHPLRSTIALGRVVWVRRTLASFAVATEVERPPGVDKTVYANPGRHPRAASVRMAQTTRPHPPSRRETQELKPSSQTEERSCRTDSGPHTRCQPGPPAASTWHAPGSRCWPRPLHVHRGAPTRPS